MSIGDPILEIRGLTRFAGINLTNTLVRIEADVRGMTSDHALEFLDGAGTERSALASADEIMRLVGHDLRGNQNRNVSVKAPAGFLAA